MGIMVFMMPAMMFSGFASPVQNMPAWLQPLAMVNPLTHYHGDHSRGVPARHAVLAGCRAHLADGASAVVTISAAAWLFRRRVQ